MAQEKLCRACLRQSPDMKNLLEDSILQQKLTDISNLELNLNESLPHFLCPKCELRLESAWEFRELCQLSNEIILKNYNVESVSLTDETVTEAINTEQTIKTRLKQFPADEVQLEIKKLQKSFYEPMKCILCDFEGSNRRAISFHMTKIHRDEKKYWCLLCNALYTDLDNHTECTKNLTCKFCDKQFSGFSASNQLLVHLESHTSARLNSCEVCGQNFSTTRKLRDHLKNCCLDVKTQSKNEKKHLCTYCGKIFNSSGRLTVHVRSHTGYCPYRCQLCEKSFTTRTQLLCHERVHSGEKPHICSFCGKGFSQSGILRTHLKQHIGRTEKCTICEKTFCRPSELKLHMRVHTGERPYKCDICPLTFMSKINLTNHKAVHSDERPYQCQHCEKAFKSSSTLKSHEQIHQGIKPFKCQFCSYACRQKHSLTQHLQNNHSIEETTNYVAVIVENNRLK